MYHSRWKGTHYEAGLKYGTVLKKNGINPLPKQKISDERIQYTKDTIPLYQEYYPEILKEIRGITDGLQIDFMEMAAFLLSMYAYTIDNYCSCFVFSCEGKHIFGRNSDFLTEIEKLCDSPFYRLDDSYAFVGNTTAWTEIEDGVNEYGLAAGLTFMYPVRRKPGFHAGTLVRYILEKCRTTKEAVEAIKKLPIGSAQAVTLLDRSGDMAVVECNCDKVIVRVPGENQNYLFTANHFISEEMQPYQYGGEDDIHSHDRYNTMTSAFAEERFKTPNFAEELLSGKYGFMCQYDRKKGMDTVWSSIFDLSEGRIYRTEGNPARRKWQEDRRLNMR